MSHVQAVDELEDGTTRTCAEGFSRIVLHLALESTLLPSGGCDAQSKQQGLRVAQDGRIVALHLNENCLEKFTFRCRHNFYEPRFQRSVLSG